MGFHDFYDDGEPLTLNEATDVCPGCGSGYAGAHGAYACGWPSADCPVMVDEMERDLDIEEFWTAGDDHQPILHWVLEFLSERTC